jgi:hypothetical protein
MPGARIRDGEGEGKVSGLLDPSPQVSLPWTQAGARVSLKHPGTSETVPRSRLPSGSPNRIAPAPAAYTAMISVAISVPPKLGWTRLSRESCTSLHTFRAAAVFYPNFYPKRQLSRLRCYTSWSQPQTGVAGRSLSPAFQAGHAGSIPSPALN